MALDSRQRSRKEPSFWKELYWFTAICLGGMILALAVLPPRLSRQRQMLELEAELRTSVEDLKEKEEEYEQAIMAMENDPFYREEVYRTRLGVKKENEEFLEDVARRFR